MRPSAGPVLLGAAVTAVVAAVVAGLFVLGSPSAERARRVDARRVGHLQAIAAATDLYWTRHSQLPTSLDELDAEPGVNINRRDPASGEFYGYQPLDSIGYELCAGFETESEQTSGYPARNLWAHGSGRQCFRLEAKEVKRSDTVETITPVGP
jgi:hypothetical protein